MDRQHFSDDLIQRIRQESDMVALISSYVSLKKTGQNWVGLCPFHSEKSPSFTVSSSKQLYHCFGCGEGGDSIGFIMKMDGATFPQAIKLLAGKIGIEVGSKSGRDSGKGDEIRDQVRRVLQDATEYFHSVLLKHPEAEAARRYLDRRELSAQTIEEFSLGYAPSRWDAIQSVLLKKGWSLELAEKAGLIIARDRPEKSRGGYYDRFRNRIIFPILDLQRRVVGFGGRVLDDSLPKYLNSPETVVFSKGHQLYALEKARKAAGKLGNMVVVEGYMDAIAAHQAGFRNVVATLGTALTPNHLQRLHRFVKTVKLLFDPDEAGIRAAIRTLDLIIPSPVSGEVVLLPAGEDPDSYIKAHGSAAFEELLNRATRLLDFVIQQGLREPEMKSIEGKLRLVDKILPVIRKVERPIERGYYLKHLAEGLGLEERELAAEMGRIRRPHPTTPSTPSGTPSRPLPKEEEILIHLMLHDPSRVSAVTLEVQQDHFTEPRLQQIFRLLSESPGQDKLETGRADPAHSEAVSLMTALKVKEPEYDDPEQTLGDCVRVLRLKKIGSSMKALEDQIRSAEEAGDYSQVKELQGKLLGLKRMTLGTGSSGASETAGHPTLPGPKHLGFNQIVDP